MIIALERFANVVRSCCVEVLVSSECYGVQSSETEDVEMDERYH